jgi:hypothetical protein
MMTKMAKLPDNPTTQRTDVTVPPKKGGTWPPILLGVLCGVFALSLLAQHEPSAFWRLTVWMFNEKPPAKLIEPRTIHFTLFMLTLLGAGGSIGVLFSSWRKRTAFLFLLAVLVAIVVFSVVGCYLD